MRFNQFREDFLTQRAQGLAQRNAEADFLCGLCTAINPNLLTPRRFLRSADSLVRESLVAGKVYADKAVRAPLVAALPRCANLCAICAKKSPRN